MSSKIKVILSFIIAIVIGSQLHAQSLNDSIDYDVNKILKENNKIIKTMLDYRYKGGSGAFERDFFFHVDYNQISRQSCIVGTTIMMFNIHCDGSLGEFSIINPLNDYLSSQLQKFFLMTKDNWNECNNSDYEYFEIPILFTIEGLQTEAIGFITNYADKEGYPCKCDNYYHEEFQRFKEKKPEKALKAMEELIRRNPYNELLINEKENLLKNFPKLKKR
ncbi:MAG: hypothetical protein IKW51_05330 [Bacteroidales bacterium]|nr:hypothetical protein [Bacteroidales bacterium]